MTYRLAFPFTDMKSKPSFRCFRFTLLLALWLFASNTWALTPEDCGAHLARLPLRTPLVRSAVDLIAYKRILADPWRVEVEETTTNGGTVISTESLAREHHITADVLTEMGIPERAHPFYNVVTGKFDYQPTSKQILSPENGDEPLSLIHLNILPGAYGDLGLQSLLPDYVLVLRRLPDLRLLLVAPPEKLKALEEWRKGLPPRQSVRVHVVSAGELGKDLTWWAQDGSKPAQSGTVGKAKFLLPRGPVQASDSLGYAGGIQGLLESGLAESVPSLFRFEGGNLVVGAKHVFVGSDEVEAAMKDFRISRSEALKALSIEFGKPVLEVGAPSQGGGKEQLVFHIDLSLSIVRNRLTQRETVVMESPTAALEIILGKGVTHSKADFEKAQAGWVEARKGKLKDYDDAEIFSLVKKMRWETLQYRILQCDFLRSQIEGHGYETVSIPGLTQMGPGGSDEAHAIPRNYTNSILSGSLALIPKTGDRGLDTAAAQTYRKLGYEVLPMSSASFLYYQNGGTRCGAQTFR
jgi:hypothetical protein